jgi:transglutaminase-like putative cysteine protease
MDLSAAADGRYFLQGIPDGIDGTRQTLAIMRRLVRMYRTNPQIRSLAESIIAEVPENDGAAEIDALRVWIRANIRYTQDVNEVETLQTPAALLQTGQGDCDDQSMLMACLAQSVGYQTRFAAVGFHPDFFEHVFTEVLLGTRWLPAETTENVSLGWYPPGVVTRITVHV